MKGKKIVGIGLIVVGIVFVALALLADYIGIGYPEHGFGRGQKVGTVMGAVVTVVGAALTFKR
jgi:hypothetical protein